MNRPLRIGFVSLHTSPTDAPGTGDAGGMNVVELNQALALGRRGHVVDLITRRAAPDLAPVSEVAEGVTLRLLDAGPPEPMAKSAQEAVIADFSGRLALLEPYDVVISQHWMSGIAALPVARRWGVPHVQSYHSIAAPVGARLDEGEPPESPGREAGERLLAAESDAIITISRAEAATVTERLGADPRKVHVVSPGVDHEVFAPAELRHAPPYIAFAARLQPLKAPDLAIRALAAIDPAVRPELWIAGDTSQDFAGYRAELDAMVDELGLGEQVRFVGSFDRPGLARFLRQAVLTVVSSYSETFGLVALESASCGTPVVASAVGGLVESVADGRSGILLRDRDPRAWGAEIERLLTDSDAYASLVHGAIAHAAAFDWDDSAAGVEVVLDRILAATGHPLGAGRVLLVHAHPDDETLATGVLIAELVARGSDVGLVTATRGERGEVVETALAALPAGVPLDQVREGELRSALHALDVRWHAYLGSRPARAAGRPERRYADSGMTWVRPGLAGPANDVGPDALTRAPLEEVSADLVAAIGAYAPDIVVTYADDGGYGHPDHVTCHQASALACARAGIPLYLVETGAEALDDGRYDALVDGRAHLRTVIRALEAHRTQLTVDGEQVVHSGGQREPIVTQLGLRRA